MKKEIHKVIILPARFLEVVGEEKVRISIMLDDGNIEDRTIPKTLTDGITNPTLLLVGITVGVGYNQLDVCDGSEYKNIFKKKYASI